MIQVVLALKEIINVSEVCVVGPLTGPQIKYESADISDYDYKIRLPS